MTHRGENVTDVRSYVMRLIDQRPDYLGGLLANFRERAFPGEGWTFRYQDFINIYDPGAIVERLQRFGSQALTTPEARHAAELFQESYDDYQRSQGSRVEEGGQDGNAG